MKTFDCQDMPKKVKKNFFDHFENVSNDCYVKWKVGSEEEEGSDDTVLSDWLIQNGAKKKQTVLIRHWW